MKELNSSELSSINGGNHLAIGLAIIAGVTFIIGVIDGYVRPLRCNQEVFMKSLSNNELLNVSGGNISGTLISALTRGVNTLLDMGRSLGNAIRRIGSGNVCPL